MPDIILTTLNARYVHASLGLRCLLANLGDLAPQAVLREFTINDQADRVVEALLALSPRLVACSVSIWNLRETTRMLGILRAVAPEVRIVLGGPELSHDWQGEPVIALADALVLGEGEAVFPDLCRELLADDQRRPLRVVAGGTPHLASLPLPYEYFTDDDLAHRLIHVESSRGCPFSCAFCLSARDERVRRIPLDAFLEAMDRLLTRGCRCFKFLDRTFNVDDEAACRILEFFLARWREGLFLHFEMVPDRLSVRLRQLLATFPPGGVQLELGIQSFDPAVLAIIGRRMDVTAAADHLTWLRTQTGAHLHVDLIAGLPGETVAGFAAGFDRLWRLRPHEIQVGILKRLKGTPLAEADHGLRFNPEPPYDLLAGPLWSFTEMQRLRRLARTVEVFANRGRFTGAFALLVGDASPFTALSAFADWLQTQATGDHGLSQERQYAFVLRHLCEISGVQTAVAQATLRQDYLRQGNERHLPECLR